MTPTGRRLQGGRTDLSAAALPVGKVFLLLDFNDMESALD
jgi:hypothetical protein